jgi:predicted Rossmann-fold nucleotide-binding protein
MHAKPIILLDIEGFYAGLMSWLRDLVGLGFVREEALAMVHVTRNMDEALDVVQRFG